ncbi:MAG: M28 family peptidase [Cyanobacteria bacterium HKST-UBA02]|nr:M28 family peptidase [Cyanobacteria bacterium HKST-UBA02]
MIIIPGSYKGELPALSDEQKELASRLSEHVHVLASEIGPRSLTRAPANLITAGAYVEHVFKKYGYSPEREEFSVEWADEENSELTSEGVAIVHTHSNVFNVVAELEGKKKSKGIVIVGAHYDSDYGCPAANDNGSGVAAMLEIARSLQEEDLERTVRFVAFTNEEWPFFLTDAMGSLQHAQTCKERKEKIEGMICLETIGYFTDEPDTQKYPLPLFGFLLPSTGNFISFIANLQSISLLRRSIKSFRENVDFPSEGCAVPQEIRGVEFSDHRNFWKFGYPAIMVTDTAFFRYPHYHTEEDTPDKIDYDKLALVVSGLTGMVRDLCMKT